MSETRCGHSYGNVTKIVQCQRDAVHDGLHSAVAGGVEWRTGDAWDHAPTERVEQEWNRECVVCGYKWTEASPGAIGCPACHQRRVSVETVEHGEDDKEPKYALAEDLKSRGMCGTIFGDGRGDEAICILPQPCERHGPCGEDDIVERHCRYCGASPCECPSADIEKRLRDTGNVLCVEAADEIERLRHKLRGGHQ